MISSFDSNKIGMHRQVYPASCIPSAVEMVLKLTNRVDCAFYELQNEWKNRSSSFNEFNGRVLHGLRFILRFDIGRGVDFPIQDLFAAITLELQAQRYVIVSLAVIGGWHMAVIYDEDDQDFVAITKIGIGDACQTAQVPGIKAAICAMQGTDILVYEYVDTE